MSESNLVTAVNKKTGLVSSVPEAYLDIYPHYREVSEVEIVKLRRKSELALFGEYRTPASEPEAAKPSEADNKEGGK